MGTDDRVKNLIGSKGDNKRWAKIKQCRNLVIEKTQGSSEMKGDRCLSLKQFNMLLWEHILPKIVKDLDVAKLPELAAVIRDGIIWKIGTNTANYIDDKISISMMSIVWRKAFKSSPFK